MPTQIQRVGVDIQSYNRAKEETVAELKRPPEDEQPLARPVHEQPLARPVSWEQEEAAQAEGERQEARQAREQQEASWSEREEGEKGPLGRILDRAQEGGWVYDSVAEKAREGGLVGKADEIIEQIRRRLAGG